MKLSRGRVQTPRLTEVIGRLIGISKKSEFEALTFRYPRGGLQRIWDAICRRCERKTQFLLRTTVESVDMVDKRITAIHCRQADGGINTLAVEPGDFVVSTLPMGVLAKIMNSVLTDETVELCRSMIRLNDLLLVFLHIDGRACCQRVMGSCPRPLHRVPSSQRTGIVRSGDDTERKHSVL